jgi:hypothetical protein
MSDDNNSARRDICAQCGQHANEHGAISHPFMPSAMSSTQRRIDDAKAEKRLRIARYGHGGGRVWIERHDGGRELVCDLYGEDTRELILQRLGIQDYVP